MYGYSRLVAMVIALAVSLAVSPSSYAQSVTDTRVSFGLDGATWKHTRTRDSTFTTLQRVIVLRGVLDGLVFGKSPLVTRDSMMDYLDTTYGHLIEALDQFYSDYRNEQVFLVWALQIVSMEIKGTAPDVVEARLVEFRREAARMRKAWSR